MPRAQIHRNRVQFFDSRQIPGHVQHVDMAKSRDQCISFDFASGPTRHGPMETDARAIDDHASAKQQEGRWRRTGGASCLRLVCGSNQLRPAAPVVSGVIYSQWMNRIRIRTGRRTTQLLMQLLHFSQQMWPLVAAQRRSKNFIQFGWLVLEIEMQIDHRQIT